MDSELIHLCRLWNTFMNSLIKARDSWAEINGIALNERPDVQDLPLGFQKAYTGFSKASFTVAMPRMIDWARAYVGMDFERFLVPEEELEEIRGEDIFEEDLPEEEMEEVIDER